MKELNTEKGWELQIKDDLGTVYCKTLFEENSVKAQKVVSTVPFPADLIFQVFSDVEERHIYNSTVVRANKLHQG